jgi:hypothetical protein
MRGEIVFRCPSSRRGDPDQGTLLSALSETFPLKHARKHAHFAQAPSQRNLPSQGTSRISMFRLVAPRTNCSVDMGRSSALASSLRTALFAWPSSGGAVVRTTSTPPEAGSAIASAEALGDTRTANRPSASVSANIAVLGGTAGLGRAITACGRTRPAAQGP